ncbi:MAG: transposase [Candidatus Riflebacteria bacterium]|nr:transposase [Candidatus Riflebacteria bacterium]
MRTKRKAREKLFLSWETVDKPEITAFKNKMKIEEAKAIYKTRSEIAEIPNVWVKEKMGLRQFSLRGLIKTYNIQRRIGLRWRSRWAKSEG